MLDLVRRVGGDGFAHHVEHAGRAHTGRYMGAKRHLAEGLFGSAVLEEHRGIVRQHHDRDIEAGERGGNFRQAAWRRLGLDLHRRSRFGLDDGRLIEKRGEDHHKQEDKHNPFVHAGGKRGERAEDRRKQHRPFAPYARQQAFSPRSFVLQVPSRRRFVFSILNSA